MPSDNGQPTILEDMSLEDIISQCLQDSKDWFPDTIDDLGFLTIALMGEVGEFANMIKKGMRGDPVDESFERDLAFEVTDIFIYLCNIVASMELDLNKMYQIKREDNVKRFGQATIREA